MSNDVEQIDMAVRRIGRSKDRLSVFEEVCRGNHSGKSVAVIAAATGLSQKGASNAGKHLADHGVIHQKKEKGVISYLKNSFLCRNKSTIVSMVRKPEKRQKLVTKRNPKVAVKTEVIVVPKGWINAKRVTIDDIGSFKKLVNTPAANSIKTMLEKDFKAGLQAVIGEIGDFKDWGGETADLWSTRVLFKGKRIAAAFAFKGRATSGVLTPAKLGKNADQIQRLLKNPAELFVVQYWGQIAPSVMEQLEVFAQIRSIQTQSKVYYCLIDGTDSNRIIETYPSHFPTLTEC